MVIRIVVCAALAAGAYAQEPGARGPMPRVVSGARFVGAEAGMPGRTIRNAPYSAEIVTEITQALPDGNRVRQTSTVRVYRDSEGRTRREQALRNLSGLAPSSNLPEVAFIYDPVAGASYALNLANRTATKSVLRHGGPGIPDGQNPDGRRGPRPEGSNPGPMARRGGNPPDGAAAPRTPFGVRSNQNLRTEALGRQMIEGVPADGTRTTFTIPSGEIGNEQPIQVATETWYAPELQLVVLQKRSDPRTGERITRYLNISRAEPPRTLFEPPADFKVK